MSQNNNVRSCPECGARLDAFSTVCMACGTVLDSSKEIVRNTPLQKQGDSSGAFYAGGASVRAVKSESEEKSDIKRHALVLFIIAATLCILFFAPFVSVRTQYNEYSTYDVKLSPVDFVKLRVKASSYLNDADLALTHEYQEYLTDKNNIGYLPSSAMLTGTQMEMVARCTKSALTVHMMRNDVSAKFNLTFALAFSAVYIIAALLALILSAFALSAIFSGKTPKKQRALGGAQKTVLFIISIIPAYIITLMHAARFGLSGDMSGFGRLGARMAWGAALVVIVFVAIIAHVCKRRLKDAAGEKGQIRFVVITRVIALACVAVATLSMFIGCLSIKTASAYGNKKSVSVKAADIYDMNYNDSYYYLQKTDLTTAEEFISYAERVAEGVTDSRSALEIFYVSAYWGGDVSDICTFISVMQILLMLSLGVVSKKMINVILSKSKFEKPQFSLFLSSLFSIVHLGLCIALSAICYTNMGFELGKYATVSVGVGPIFTVICISGVVASLLIHAPEIKEREYDKPDVSCAPYVV